MEEEKKEINEELGHEPAKGVDEENEDKNAIALFSYLGILLIIPLLVDKDDPFVKFHVKQGLTLLIAALVVPLVAWIPILGWIFGLVAAPVLLIFAIIGVINALSGKKKELPLIGKYGRKFNF